MLLVVSFPGTKLVKTRLFPLTLESVFFASALSQCQIGCIYVNCTCNSFKTLVRPANVSYTKNILKNIPPPPVLNSWIYNFNIMTIYKYYMYMYKHIYFHRSPSAWSKLPKKFYENFLSTFIHLISYTLHKIFLYAPGLTMLEKWKWKCPFFRPLQHYPRSHVTPSQINVKYDSKVHDSWMNIHLGQLISHFKC